MNGRVVDVIVLAVAFAWLSAGCAIDDVPSSGEDADTPYCVVQIQSNQEVCYSTIKEAVALATGGEILDAPEDDSAQGREELARRISAVSPGASLSIVLGHFFKDRAWGGSMIFFTAPSGCDASMDVDWEVVDLGSTSFNDSITSFEPFANCLVTIWEHAGFGGASLGPVGRISFGGSAMDDKASSIQFH